MKKLIYLGVLLMMACNSADNAGKKDKHELAGILFKQQQAWNTGNLEAFMDGYSRDTGMQFITRRGVRKGWQATLNGYRKSYPNKDSMGELEFKIQQLEFLDDRGDVGHIVGTWKLIRHNDTPGGHFSLITRREAQGHRIWIDHTW